MPRARGLPNLPDDTPCQMIELVGMDELDTFLSGLDWVLFFEQPWATEIFRQARARNVKVVCVPMWEFLDEQAPWLSSVDLMIAPTQWCHELLLQWRERLGLLWEDAVSPLAHRHRSLSVQAAGGLPDVPLR